MTKTSSLDESTSLSVICSPVLRTRCQSCPPLTISLQHRRIFTLLVPQDLTRSSQILQRKFARETSLFTRSTSQWEIDACADTSTTLITRLAQNTEISLQAALIASNMMDLQWLTLSRTSRNSLRETRMLSIITRGICQSQHPTKSPWQDVMWRENLPKYWIVTTLPS